MQTHPIILGTAGHIDHGKTTLVQALTGIDTDRLKEEKARGITIELGFAHLDVDGRRFGLVDVPGHERFIKSMAAGAGGVDVVMLVIAADEGVMPQTREHLDICQLLGVKRGLVALTKMDLVDAELAELVQEDIRGALAGTFLAQAPVVPVSARTGDGMAALRTELLRLAGEVPARSADGVFRLPLDRVFTMKGFGTVVTGTILGGRIRVGDDVVAHPRGVEGKVRGLQVHGEQVPEARAGMRCAANLGGVDREALRRGDIVSAPGALTPTHLLDARLHYLRTSRAPLVRQSRLLLHHATSQVMANVVLVEADRLEPGEAALVQLRLEEPVAALPGDRFILRGFTPQEHYGTTVGGGEILRVHAPKVRRAAKEEAARTLQQIAEADPSARVALEIRGAGPAGMDRQAVLSRLGISPQALSDALNRLVQTGDLLRAGDLYLHAEPLARLEAQALAAVEAFHADKPHLEGIAREELRTRLPRSLPPRLFEALLDGLVRRKAVVAERDVVRRPRHRPKEAAGQTSATAEKVAERFARWGLETPKPQDVHAEVGAPAAEVRAALDVLLREGRLVRVRPDYYADAQALLALRRKLEAFLDEHGQITPQQWKSLCGLTRKYAIPLAEHFDHEKVTLRVGDIRKRRG